MATSTAGSPSWQALLERALRAIDAAAAAGGEFSWSMGGGTVLMLHYAHRSSRDIDIFLKDPQLLTLLSPRLNQVAASIARDYVEASSFLKLACDEGEIDFIVAPSLTPAASRTREILRRQVVTDAPAEIVVKKAFYRASELRPRDVFDLAVVLDDESAGLRRHASVLSGKKDVLAARLAFLRPRYEGLAAREIMLLPAGERYLKGAIDVVTEFVRTLGPSAP